MNGARKLSVLPSSEREIKVSGSVRDLAMEQWYE